MARLFRVAKHLLFGVILCAGWLALILAAVLVVVEKTGLLARFVREIAAARLGVLGDELVVHDARLSWFVPALELRGIELGKNGESVRLDSARLDFSFDRGPIPRLARAEVRGGRVRLSPALINGFQSLRAPAGEPGQPARSHSDVPTVRVEDIDVDLLTARFGRIPLGRLDAFLRADDRGEPELWGRMIPSLAASAASSGEIYLHGKVRDPGSFEVNATATHLPIGTDYLPAGSELDVVRAYEPHGWLDLDAWAFFSLDGRVAPRARGRLSITSGGARLAGGKQRLEDLRFDLGMSWTPESASEWANPHAWQGELKLAAKLGDNPFEATAILGTEAGALYGVKAWVHAPRVQLARDLLDVLGQSPTIETQWSAYEARGEAELWVGARLPRSFVPGEKIGEKLELAMSARFDGAAGLTYRGYKSATSGLYDGFPLPLDKIRGGIVFARDPQRLRPYRVGLVDLSGDHGAGLIHAQGVIQAHAVDVPPFVPGYGAAELDIELASKDLPIDDRLRRAVTGLENSVPAASTWEPLGLTSGKLDVDLRLVRRVDMDYVAVDLGIDTKELAMSWAELPVPISRGRGHFTFRSDGHVNRGLALVLDGVLVTAPRLHIAMRAQTDPSTPRPPAGKPLDEILSIAVDVDHVSLTGADKQIFGTAFPDIALAMADMSPKGFADIRYERVRIGKEGDSAMRAEVTPRDHAQLTPKRFQMITSDVRGRVLVSSVERLSQPAETTTRLAPLIGTWDQKVQVAFLASYPERTVRMFGAGLDPASKSLLGSLRQAIQSPGEEPVDLTAIRVEGPLDLIGVIEIPDSPEQKNASHYRFFLRDSVLSTADGFRLDDLVGELNASDGELRGDRLTAVLARTPVVLRDLRFASDKDGFRLETSFDATSVPIDREHLSAFVDPSTLEGLIEELRWRGSLDVRGGRIVLSGPTQGRGKLELSGKVTPHDVFVQMGLPITVRSASATIEKLIYEGGRVRAVVRIDDLYGEVADRVLGPASLLVTYAEPKLSIENLSGRFEGGELLPLGIDATRRGTVFSIGLEPPFNFQLALRLKAIEVAGLVRGLFPSNLATRGRFDAQIRLTGDMDHLLGISGTGSVMVVESRLWSIPVFRALFAQLGLDDTAVFDSMATNITVQDGRIAMNDITLRSPLLQLVGSGALDFDGAIKYDLEVRYDLIDRLGPITRLLYFLQNQLLSVAIRGDMGRPEIIFENPFTSLFGTGQREKRALPLPGWSTLPKRF